MRTLLNAGVVGDALLLKVVVTNIFCIIRASDSRSQSAPLRMHFVSRFVRLPA